ncbi:MAG: 30S ribosomal protein S6--L-glutamate ligase [Planctomycetes bacterium]|nr:30S ribosomal protein S6--L-glutamate ligase [Planctomycetota bacterium]
MKIAILSRDPKLYSTRRLMEAVRARDHDVRVVDPLRCTMNITADRPDIHYKGETLTGLDAVIPRIGASISFYGTAVVRQFETIGIFALNSSVAIARARDKLHCLQLLARKGIGLPATGFANRPDDHQDLIDLVGGPPMIIKLLEGTQGRGVVLAETRKAAQSVIEAFRNLQAHFLVQEFVREARGTDLRCFVIGDEVIASMRRRGRADEFRANLHRGGSAERVEITEPERATAIRAAQIVGLSVSGVDILRSDRGPLVLEVNSSPGLRGIEETTKQDIAGLIAAFVEKRVLQKRAVREEARG